MRKRFFVLLSLVSLFVFVYFLGGPILVLQIRADAGARIYCAPIAVGDEIIYHSVNSIYRVPVEERLRVEDEGALVPIEVISTPDVVYYYGIESFERVDDATVRATPRAAHYREVRIKVGRAGQQYLIVRGQKIALYELVGEGEVVTIATRETPRAFACG